MTCIALSILVGGASILILALLSQDSAFSCRGDHGQVSGRWIPRCDGSGFDGNAYDGFYVCVGCEKCEGDKFAEKVRRLAEMKG